MSKLDEILTDNAATLFAMGQDWTKGDGSASKVDVEVDKAKEQIKELFLEILDFEPYTFEQYDLIASLRDKVKGL